jgi:hypothetical protein
MSVLPRTFQNLMVVCLVAYSFWSNKFLIDDSFRYQTGRSDWSWLLIQTSMALSFSVPLFYLGAGVGGVIETLNFWGFTVLLLGYAGRPKFHHHSQSPHSPSPVFSSNVAERSEQNSLPIMFLVATEICWYNFDTFFLTSLVRINLTFAGFWTISYPFLPLQLLLPPWNT